MCCGVRFRRASKEPAKVAATHHGRLAVSAVVLDVCGTFEQAAGDTDLALVPVAFLKLPELFGEFAELAQFLVALRLLNIAHTRRRLSLVDSLLDEMFDLLQRLVVGCQTGPLTADVIRRQKRHDDRREDEKGSDNDEAEHGTAKNPQRRRATQPDVGLTAGTEKPKGTAADADDEDTED